MSGRAQTSKRRGGRWCGVAAVFLVSFVLTARCVAQDEKPVLFVGRTPAEVYQIIHQAKWNVDVATVMACTSRRAGATEERVYLALMRGRSELPQSIKVLTQKVRPTMATMILDGLRRDRETGEYIRSRGTVTMVKEDGTWRLRLETWKRGPAWSPDQ